MSIESMERGAKRNSDGHEVFSHPVVLDGLNLIEHDMWRRLRRIVRALKSNKDGIYFNEPIDPNNFSRYFEVGNLCLSPK